MTDEIQTQIEEEHHAQEEGASADVHADSGATDGTKKGGMEINESYVKELRNQNKLLRLKTKETSDEIKKANEKIEEIEKTAKKRIIDAEIKIVASKYKIIDKDDIKLADLSNVSVDENGEVRGIEEAFQSLKEKKPYLFQSASTSNGVYDRPSPSSQKTEGWVKDLNEADYEKAKYAAIYGE